MFDEFFFSLSLSFVMITNETTMAAPNSSSSRIPKKTVNDFKFIKEIGNGSYSTVKIDIEKLVLHLQLFRFFLLLNQVQIVN
jgi:hypothetical protein